ncbi:MAG: hypothetical protein QGH51_06615 [Planctomycetota bacterium]|jgi:hypothetical protein|nr:hypothetical protein [Planctomycetota bacterium]MDP6941686.1 hypothetical protein [Planctomycetota bacterium]
MLATLLLFAPPLLAVPCPNPLPQGDDRVATFREGFAKAVRMKEREDMDRFMKRYTEEAINEFVVQADNRARNPGGELGIWVDNFVESWNRTYRNDFARNYDRFLQLRLPSNLRQIRGETINGPYYEATLAHFAALQSQDIEDWVVVRALAEASEGSFIECGDTFFASRAVMFLGNSFHPDFTNGEGDASKALACYHRFMEYREKCLLKQDRNYNEVKGFIRDLETRLGIGGDADEATKPKKVRKGSPVPPAEGAKWEKILLEPNFDSKLAKITHSNDWADDHRMSWPFSGTAGVGSTVKLWLFDPPVFVKRTDNNEFVVEAGAEPSKPFKLSLKPTIVSFNRLIDDLKVPHAIAFAGGAERDPLHGQEMNFALSDNSATFFFRPVATRTAKTPFGPLTIWDLDCDGLFGTAEAPLPRAYVGVPEDTFFYRHDAVMLGKSKHSIPYCRWISDSKGNWYEIQLMSHQEGTEAQIRKLAPRLGSAKVDLKGVKGMKLVSLVLESDSGKTKGLVVDVMAQRREASLPAGRYKLQMGILRSKKGDEEAILLPPSALSLTWDIEESKTTEISLGAPFTFEVRSQTEGNQFILEGASLFVRGDSGERYMRLVGAPLFGVEVEVKGNKKAATEFAASNVNQMNGNFLYAYQPQDAIIPLKDGASPKYRLSLDKHPWFGKIQTGWLE